MLKDWNPEHTDVFQQSLKKRFLGNFVVTLFIIWSKPRWKLSFAISLWLQQHLRILTWRAMSKSIFSNYFRLYAIQMWLMLKQLVYKNIAIAVGAVASTVWDVSAKAAVITRGLRRNHSSWCETRCWSFDLYVGLSGVSDLSVTGTSIIQLALLGMRSVVEKN